VVGGITGVVGTRMLQALQAVVVPVPTGFETLDDAPETPGVEPCLRRLAEEGECLLREGLARCAGDIDVLCVDGQGFPRHWGGPMWHAAEVGR
jgi:hypothetical protein